MDVDRDEVHRGADVPFPQLGDETRSVDGQALEVEANGVNVTGVLDVRALYRALQSN